MTYAELVEKIISDEGELKEFLLAAHEGEAAISGYISEKCKESELCDQEEPFSKPRFKNAITTLLLTSIKREEFDAAKIIHQYFFCNHASMPAITLTMDGSAHEVNLFNAPLIDFLELLFQQTAARNQDLLKLFEINLERPQRHYNDSNANTSNPTRTTYGGYDSSDDEEAPECNILASMMRNLQVSNKAKNERKAKQNQYEQRLQQLPNIISALKEIFSKESYPRKLTLLTKLPFADFTHETVEVLINVLKTFGEMSMASYLFHIKWANVNYTDFYIGDAVEEITLVKKHVNQIIDDIKHPVVIHEIMLPLLQLADWNPQKFNTLVNELLSAKESFELDINANICVLENKQITILYQLALNNSWDTVHTILETYDNPVLDIDLEGTSQQGKNLLVMAASDRKWEVVQLILAKFPHANINAHCTVNKNIDEIDENVTSLYFAASDKQADTSTMRHAILLQLLGNPRLDVSILPARQKNRKLLMAMYNLKKALVNDEDPSVSLLEILYLLQFHRLNQHKEMELRFNQIIPFDHRINPSCGLDCDDAMIHYISCTWDKARSINQMAKVKYPRRTYRQNYTNHRKLFENYFNKLGTVYAQTKEFALGMACLLPIGLTDTNSQLFRLPIEVRYLIAEQLLHDSGILDFIPEEMKPRTFFRLFEKFFENRNSYEEEFTAIDNELSDFFTEKKREITIALAVRAFRQELGFFHPLNIRGRALAARTLVESLLKKHQDQGVILTKNLRDLIVFKMMQLAKQEHPCFGKSVVKGAIQKAIEMDAEGCSIGNFVISVRQEKHSSQIVHSPQDDIYIQNVCSSEDDAYSQDGDSSEDDADSQDGFSSKDDADSQDGYSSKDDADSEVDFSVATTLACKALREFTDEMGCYNPLFKHWSRNDDAVNFVEEVLTRREKQGLQFTASVRHSVICNFGRLGQQENPVLRRSEVLAAIDGALLTQETQNQDASGTNCTL